MANDLPYRCTLCMKWGNRASDELELVGEQGQQQYVCVDREACGKRAKQMEAERPAPAAAAPASPPDPGLTSAHAEAENLIDTHYDGHAPDLDGLEVLNCYVGQRATFIIHASAGLTPQGPIVLPVSVEGRVLAVLPSFYILANIGGGHTFVPREKVLWIETRGV